MACCVVIMAFIAQLFALRRKVRRALGVPVGDWDEDEAQPSILSVWIERFRGLLRYGPARAVLVALVCAEITFAIIAAPGDRGLIAEHRLHARQAWEYVRSFGIEVADVSALWCTSTRDTLRGYTSPPPRSERSPEG